MSFSTELPETFQRRVMGAFPEGAAWLKTIPALLSECESRWQIQVGEPLELSYSYVAVGRTAGGNEVVLKLAVPNRELRCEIAALHLYDGIAAVRLLDSDAERGWLLLERLSPGEKLALLPDDDGVAGVVPTLVADHEVG